MGFLSRISGNREPDLRVNDLDEFGRLEYEASRGQRVGPEEGQLKWERWVQPVMAAYQSDPETTVDRVHGAAMSQGGMALYGGHRLISEIDPECRNPKYLELLDGALEMLKDKGHSSGILNRYEADRWIQTHGDLRYSFDGIVEVAPPPTGSRPPVADLVNGESRLVAIMGPEHDANRLFVERNEGGTYVVMIEAPQSADDPTRSKGPWPGVSGSSMEEILVRLGAELQLSTYWAHDDLQPYFTATRT